MKKSTQIAFIICIVILIAYVFLKSQKHRFPLVVIKSYEGLEIDYDKNTLITFDVDETIIMSKDPYALPYGFYGMPLWQQIWGLLRHPSLLLHYETVTAYMFEHSPRMLVEPAIETLINHLKKKCMVVGLSSVESGKWGFIESMPQWRVLMLASFGIYFSVMQNDVFKNLPKHRGTYPKLYDGILCANQQPKGVVLGAFIDSLPKKPDKVVSFDDSINALVSINAACEVRNIPFIAYNYVGAKDRRKIDYTKAMQELDQLVQNALNIGVAEK